MDLWNRNFLRFTLIEWIVALVALLVIARFIWTEKVVGIEHSLFESIGLGGGAKYLLTVPLAVRVLYRMIKREQVKADLEGKKAVRPQVLVVSIGVSRSSYRIYGALSRFRMNGCFWPF